MTDNSDLGLETLLAVRQELSPDLDEQLLRSCYSIQKKHQFDSDRVTPTQTMDRLIEKQVDRIVSSS